MVDIGPITLAIVGRSFQTLMRETRHVVTRALQICLVFRLTDVSVSLRLDACATAATTPFR